MNVLPPSLRARVPRAGVTIGLASVAVLALGCAAWAQTATPQPAEVPAPLKANPGDTAWMLISSALVLMMSVPGLALFYGGLVRSKNMLSVLSQVFAMVSLVGIVWVVYGYSLAFGDGGGYMPYIGGFNKAFLAGIGPGSMVPTFSHQTVIPELAYMVFQMTFAMITPALIIGAFAERIRFSALMVFTLLWATFIYFPIAHW
ncbi:MAG: ammonium transporter, partial [Parafilimonas terrae]|nr:ammonium transporter [Parafilimonas terrae]